MADTMDNEELKAVDIEGEGNENALPVPEESPPPPPQDARVDLFFDEMGMLAEAVVSPPVGQGAPVSREMLDEALAGAGVVFGILEKALEDLCEPPYGRRVAVAKGVPAKDGVNGTCTEMFEREASRVTTERADGTVDYRELGLIRDLKAGTPICTMTQPSQGQDGSTVHGKVLKAKNGEKVLPLLGENTVMSEDGNQALTAAEGNLVFRSGRFTVETVYRVENVDYDIGNINFSGDVKIAGDLADGFSITAGGDVSVFGQVGTSEITAKNITLDKGINGTGRATLTASSTVKAGFIENCIVRAGEKVVASSLINCQVECEGDVDITGGKGIICGGKIMTLGSISAKQVGNDSNTLTVISLGVTPKLINERKRIQAQLTEVEKHIEELQKNVSYIEKLVAGGKPVPPERVQMLRRAQISLPISQKKQEQLTQQLQEIEDRMANAGNVQLTARTIYSPTKISIGTASANVAEEKTNCRVYRSGDGEVVFGTK